MHILELFTSPTCPYCPEAKQIVEEIVKMGKEMVLIERDVSEEENAEIARRYDIYGVPTLIVNSKYKLEGIPDTRELKKFLNVL